MKTVAGISGAPRRQHEKSFKAELVEQCLGPGASVAAVALAGGINANLLRKWIGERRRVVVARSVVPVSRAVADAAFVPLQLETVKAKSVTVPAVMVRLHVRLANGVAFDLSEASPDALSPVIGLLSSLPCSSSTAR